jgi:hypothetical protein
MGVVFQVLHAIYQTTEVLSARISNLAHDDLESGCATFLIRLLKEKHHTQHEEQVCDVLVATPCAQYYAL